MLNFMCNQYNTYEEYKENNNEFDNDGGAIVTAIFVCFARGRFC